MKVGDMIDYRGTIHIVLNIRPSMPVARRGLEQVVIKDMTTLKNRTIPIKWIMDKEITRLLSKSQKKL